MSSYRTIQGDTWDMICYRLTGSTSKVDQLISANQDHIGTYIFPADIILRVPDFDIGTSGDLPPWKQ